MKIGVDGGGLCVDRNHKFGNFIFTDNLLTSLAKFDKKNQYLVYTFCDGKLNLKSKNIQIKKIGPKLFWSKLSVSYQWLKSPVDVYLAVNQSTPFFIRPKKIISFSHGLSFYFYKEFYPYSWKKMYQQHQEMIKKTDCLIVSSSKVKNEIVEAFRVNDKKIKVILYGIPQDLLTYKKIKQNRRENFFLSVGMNHKIKNFYLLKKIFERFNRNNQLKNYKLIIINKGYSHKDLTTLYQKATAYLTTSLYESFNFPVLEALSQGCPVIGLKSAIIPELRKYCLVAEDEDDFLSFINQVVKDDFRYQVDIEQLKKEFSWKKYVYTLIKLLYE